MDKKDKFLLSCSAKQRELLLVILQKLSVLDFSNLDIKRIEGGKNAYRCRVWRIRIRFVYDGQKVEITKIGYRGDIYK